MKPQFAIFSTMRKPGEVLNRARFLKTNIKSLLGCYKGELELSYMVPMDAFYDMLLFWQYEESVLLLGDKDKLNRRQAQLLYIPNEKTVDIGRFRTVGHSYAITQDAWTYDVSTNKYYIAD